MRGINFHDDFGWTNAPRFGGGGTTSTNTIQNTAPWSGEQGFLSGTGDINVTAPGGAGLNGSVGVYPDAAALYGDTSAWPQYYPSDTYAPMTGQQTGLMSNLINYTDPGLNAADSNVASTLSPQFTAQTQGTFNQGTNVLGNELSAGYLNPANSPSYQTAVSNAIASAVPSASASFVNGNRSDSGLATAASTSAAANAAGGLAQQQYDVNQGIQNQAAGTASNNLLTQQADQSRDTLTAPMVDQAQVANLTTGLNAAGMAQTNAQNQLNANVAAYNYGQLLPYNMLGTYESEIAGTGNPGSSSTSTGTEPYFTNPTADILGGATSALASGAAINSIWPNFFPAVGSAIGTMFSDRRLKTDIEKIGESDSGFPLYLFRYKGESPMARHIGLMAQDVEKERPDAVIHTPGGMMVKYLEALAA